MSLTSITVSLQRSDQPKISFPENVKAVEEEEEEV
jgi:hypothetical protein